MSGRQHEQREVGGEDPGSEVEFRQVLTEEAFDDQAQFHREYKQFPDSKSRSERHLFSQRTEKQRASPAALGCHARLTEA